MTKLKPGDKAPHFSAEDQDGNLIRLEDYKGKRLVLYFYPKDSTPGCTMQACNLTENQAALKAAGFEILGVSADSAKRHQNFIIKNKIGFPLLVDEEKTIINNYGVWGPKKFMGREFDGIHRITFIIDKQGLIEHVITKVKTKDHANQILELLN